ncbi:autophagy-related protein 13b-like [Durio zibethinus]|uniref:Autophagy-related protein 13b-like n=1 Tax=Durio zibethinus TaxID=66656 RepID=A0A6P6BCR4_DURZI|nr:autophagy-related protein 13b-like [Durio zibethinus]XP_022774867.1 autophagy-related protein 13b-like [Durio zibethinus]XP_022774868.1 autophagy-related protein 13b-like [Durio zibethinus]
MASSHINTHTKAAKMEQVITEFFYKSLLIILESRSPYVSSRNYSGEQIVLSPSSSSSSSSSVRPRDKWFNLALRECPSALENLDLYRQSNFDLVVVDVILEQKPLDWEPLTVSPKRDLVRNLSSKDKNSFCWNSDQEELGTETKNEKIIERWFVQHESRKGRDSSSGSRRSSSNNLSMLYKKLILLLRSLYVTVRLLPAYKIFRDLNSTGQICAFKLVPRVYSFVEPFTPKEEAEMQRFWFTPVDTSCGRLCLSVLYGSSISDISSKPSTPMTPQFIPDYVGSPLADPLRRFPSLPVSHGSPSSLPFSRRHSWSYDHYKPSPPLVSFSPSPTHSESHASISNPSSRHLPPMSLPRHPHEASLAHKKNTNFDEYCPSPNFSASPSPSPLPSPPIHFPGSHMSKALLRSESAPVNIPAPIANFPALSCQRNLPPSPTHKITRAGTSRTDNNMGPVQTGATIEKLFSFGKEDCQKYSGVKVSSNSSPRISFSRSSSRSLQDDFDDSEFPCPFDVEDDDMADPGCRPESYDRRAHPSDPNEAGLFMNRKSQVAAVGALVRMLKKAPPLRQDISSSINFSEASRPEMWSNSMQEQNQISEAVTVEHAASSSIASSRLVASKTTADALEELRGYKEVKNLLLGEGSKSCTSANYASGAEHSSQGPREL